VCEANEVTILVAATQQLAAGKPRGAKATTTTAAVLVLRQ
jgi:hypothetical protein